MTTFVLMIHISVSLFLIVAVLLQAGKGASIGATFGGGGGQTLFGSSQGTFMGKVTTAAAILFMFTSLTLAYFSSLSSTATIMSDSTQIPQTEIVQEPTAGEATGDATEPAN